MSHRVWRSSGVTIAMGLVFVAGCATKTYVVNLREPGDLPVRSSFARTYPYSDSTWAPAVVGHLSEDSLSIYRPREGAWYRWKAGAVGDHGVAIGGYTLADGRHVSFLGQVRRAGDSLAFERSRWSHGMEARKGPDSFVLPLEGVRSVEVWFPDAGRTVMLWGGLLVLVAGGLALSIASAFDESLM